MESKGPNPFLYLLRPEASSLNAIIQENNRTRLYINPLHWTSLQPQLLRCEFVRLTPVRNGPEYPLQVFHVAGDSAKPSKDDSESADDYQKPPQEIRPTAKELLCEAVNIIQEPESYDKRTRAVQSLLRKYSIKMADVGNLEFHFKQKGVAKMPNDGIFWHSKARSRIPTIAYVDISRLSLRRDDSFNKRPVPLDSTARVVPAVWENYRHRIQPPNELEDPYFVALMIGLAQLKSRKIPAEVSQSGLFFQTYLLALSSTNGADLYFYSATISYEFLCQFDSPSKHSPSDSVIIKYYQIPLGTSVGDAAIMDRAMRAVQFRV